MKYIVQNEDCTPDYVEVKNNKATYIYGGTTNKGVSIKILDGQADLDTSDNSMTIALHELADIVSLYRCLACEDPMLFGKTRIFKEEID